MLTWLMSYTNNDTMDSATQKNTTITIGSKWNKMYKESKEVKHSTTDNMDNNNSGGDNSGMYLFQNMVVGMS